MWEIVITVIMDLEVHPSTSLLLPIRDFVSMSDCPGLAHEPRTEWRVFKQKIYQHDSVSIAQMKWPTWKIGKRNPIFSYVIYIHDEKKESGDTFCFKYYICDCDSERRQFSPYQERTQIYLKIYQWLSTELMMMGKCYTNLLTECDDEF